LAFIARLLLAAACAAPITLRAVPTLAQESEELILDPELSDVPAPPAASPPVTAEPNGEAHFSLRSRVGVDITREEPREDIWEFTQIATFEAKVRRSEHVRFAVGLRIRHWFAMRQTDTDDANKERYALDVTPTAGYGDVTLADGVHLRVGYQSVQLGKFDLVNETDVLSIYDFRSGITAPEDAYEIAQPAVRLDWDLSSAVSLTGMYVPFFQTHRWSVLDGDYAFFPNAPPYDPQSGLPEDANAQVMLRTNLSRSVQANLGDGAFAAFTPDVNLKQPQLAAHLTWHGVAGELGFTAAIARDQTPSFQPPDLRIGYEQFEMFSVDGTTDVGPVQVGFEAAYMAGRTLLTTLPGPIPPTGTTDLVVGGVRMNYARGETFAFVVEATVTRAMTGAPTATRDVEARWLWLFSDAWWFTLGAYATLTAGDATFSLGSTVLNGPSYILVPKAEVRVASGLKLELGANLVGDLRGAGATGLVAGSLYDHTDQVFLGLHWVP
jgi:hypothetical protein